MSPSPPWPAEPSPTIVRPARRATRDGDIDLEVGPLPLPEVLQAYNHVFPDCAERILAIVERQAEHRQRLEAASVQGALRAQERAQHFAFVIAFGALAGGVWLLSLGESLQGFTLVGGDALVFGGLYWLGRRRQNKERQRTHDESRPGIVSRA
jgi:uncharacterized membrane protein